MIRILLLLLLLNSPAEAAFVPTATLKWNLVSENINIKCMTASGDFVWCGTDDSLYRFHRVDGAFERFSAEDGLTNSDITCIAADSSGTIWFGSSDRLTSYKDSVFTDYDVSDGLVFPDIKALTTSNDGVLWVLEQNGNSSAVQTFDGSEWKTCYISEDADVMFSMAVDDSGYVWLGGEGKVI